MVTIDPEHIFITRCLVTPDTDVVLDTLYMLHTFLLKWIINLTIPGQSVLYYAHKTIHSDVIHTSEYGFGSEDAGNLLMDQKSNSSSSESRFIRLCAIFQVSGKLLCAFFKDISC